ncbi:MAG TPA: sugar phosphate isomerase/epimerase [Cyclobacteriaceae bacterium]|nr:sugar phosphate isomerase/epimerase [Cyclobacteriaceae bacterium]
MNRRDFTKLSLTGASAALLGIPNFNLFAQPSTPNRSLISGVQFGVQPFCYHDLVMNRENRPELLRRIVQNGFGMVELHATWCEPRFTAPGVSTLQAREKLREWRLNAPAEYYQAIRKEFDDAGVSIFTYYVNMDVSYQNENIDYTEAEVDATFRAAKILGAGGCIGSQGLNATKRLAPFATKNGMFLSVHNHANLSDPDAINNEESFVKAFTFSPDVVATFDTRHFTAANGDCLAFIEKHHTHIRNIHLGDRRKNQGHSVPFGEGDAPIIEILRMIQDNKWPIVVMLEFEHGTLRTGLQETQLMFDYCKRALA